MALAAKAMKATNIRNLCTQQWCPDPSRYVLVSDGNGSVFKLSLDGICTSSKQVKTAWVQSDGSCLVLTYSNELFVTWNAQSIWRESSESKESADEEVPAKRSRSEEQQQVCKIQQWNEPIACNFVKDEPRDYIVVASKSTLQMVRSDSTSNVLPCAITSLLKADPTTVLMLGSTKSSVLVGLSNGDVVDSSSGKTIASLDDKVLGLLQIRDNYVIAIASSGSGCFIQLGSSKNTTTNFTVESPILNAFFVKYQQMLVCLTSRGFMVSMQMTFGENGEIELSLPQKIYLSDGRIMRAFQISPNSIAVVFGEEETWCVYNVSLSDIDSTSRGRVSLSTLLDRLEQLETNEFVEEDNEDAYLMERIANAGLAITLKNEKIKCSVRVVRLGCDLRLRISVEDTTSNNHFGISHIPINVVVQLQQGTVQEVISESMIGKQEIEIVPSSSFSSNGYNRLLPLTVKATSYVVFENGSGISKVIATSRFDAFDLGEFNFPSRPLSQKPHQAYPIIQTRRRALVDKLAYAETHVAGTILRATLPSHCIVTDHSNFKASSNSPEMRILLDVDGDKVDLQLMANDIMVAAVARSALLARFAELLKDEVLLPRFSLSAKRSVAHLHAMCESLDQATTNGPVSKATMQHIIAMNTAKTWQAVRASSYNNVQM